MKEGDFIVAIEDKSVKWASHDEVVSLIKNTGDLLCLKVVTPLDREYLKVNNNEFQQTNHFLSVIITSFSAFAENNLI